MIELPKNESIRSYFEQWYLKEKKKLAKDSSESNAQIFNKVRIKLVIKLIERLAFDLSNSRLERGIIEKEQMLNSYKEILDNLEKKVNNVKVEGSVEVNEEIKMLLNLVEKEDLSLVLNEMKEFEYKKMQVGFNLYKQNEQEYFSSTMNHPSNRLNEIKIRLNLLNILEEGNQVKKVKTFTEKLLAKRKCSAIKVAD